MCSTACPCYFEHSDYDIYPSNYDAYQSLGDQFLEFYGRIFGSGDPRDANYLENYHKEKEESKLTPFYWTLNPEHAFETYTDCLKVWEHKGNADRSLDIYTKLHFEQLEEYH